MLDIQDILNILYTQYKIQNARYTNIGYASYTVYTYYTVGYRGCPHFTAKGLWQGLGYSRDSTAKVLTKFCTPNDSPKKYYRSKNNF